jgi:dTDP-4-amino-4,6-dideoxygalactose transaminase
MSDSRKTSNVPFLDLVSPHLELEAQLLDVVRGALRTAGFIGGPMVSKFEQEFAAFCASKHCVGVSSGTDALRFALIAAGVRPGDTVVTVANTFIATTEAISQAGARFDFVDVDPRTYTLDPEKLRTYLESECAPDLATGRTVNKWTGSPVTAIVPVHLYGQVADMDRILELAAQHNLVVVEDACQAHGAEYYSRKEGTWRRAGSMGAASAFSFYPGKNLGACGEAGAITTNDENLAKTCRMLREHGQSKKYYHEMEGYNGRLDAIHAGMLSLKLQHLPAWNAQRRASAEQYGELLKAAGDTLVLPFVPEWSRPVYHLYVVLVADREAVQKQMDAAGIGTGIHYPIPLHLSQAYEKLGFRPGDLPVTEHAAAHVLSLPMFPGLSLESQARAAAALLDCVKRTGSVPRRSEDIPARARVS